MLKFNLEEIQELVNYFMHTHKGGELLINIEETVDGFELVAYDNELAEKDSGYSFVNTTELFMWCFEEFVAEHKYELFRINLSTLAEIEVYPSGSTMALKFNYPDNSKELDTKFEPDVGIHLVVLILEILEETNLDIKVSIH